MGLEAFEQLRNSNKESQPQSANLFDTVSSEDFEDTSSSFLDFSWDNQPASQSTSQSTGQPVNNPINNPVNNQQFNDQGSQQFESQPFGNQQAGQPMNNQQVNQQVNQPAETWREVLGTKPVPDLVNNQASQQATGQPVNQSINQPVNQPVNQQGVNPINNPAVNPSMESQAINGKSDVNRTEKGTVVRSVSAFGGVTDYTPNAVETRKAEETTNRTPNVNNKPASKEVKPVNELGEEGNVKIVEEYPVTTPDKLVSQPTEDSKYSSLGSVGLSVLGLNSGKQVTLVKPALRSDIAPLSLDNIIDATGDISSRLTGIMHLTGATVLPLKECGVFESITKIPDFKIRKVKGKSYASYTGVNYPTAYIDKIIGIIRGRILEAKYFGVDYDAQAMKYVKLDESVLCREVEINGRTCVVPSLCESELSHLATYFSNFNTSIIRIVDSFDNLIVGLPLDDM